METLKNLETKLWNKNFFLLWQGQMVSVLGDVFYLMALNFWMLEITGSTALMGMLSAVTMLPKIILGPFAGVFVDRWDRKKLIVLTDLIRGVIVTFVGIAGVMGFIQVWMVFIVGIISGICAAFFNPAINSSRPDIVPEDKLLKANSVISLAQSGMDMIGNAVGGVLYVLIGAPYMFLLNGISYLFSAFTEIFITIPKVKREEIEITFIEDFKLGIKFLNDFKVYKKMFICSSIINFFGNAGMILLIPYFNETEFLGAQKYGFAMMVLAMGMVFGSILLSIKGIKRENKFKVFNISLVSCTTLLLVAIITNNYIVLLLCWLFGFFFNVIFNTIFSTAAMSTIPSDIRGKVMAITSAISMGLVPIGQLLAGVLGDLMPIRLVLFIMFLCCFIIGFLYIRIKNLKRFIEYDSEYDNLEELMKL
ncbi:MFS transporter [Paraclostridium sordellii]|uniref:MFS family transporter protein n=1 Tax=Paraclostridium sordellii TaxID=1505 RepID=A0A9P1P9K8_PARSO|nr:MFS transporter [Paeniclostridium sordellii]CEO33109.1 MFS family transporter protein [[Clostridium] sordellii] [Paeniclostridium sordellii]